MQSNTAGSLPKMLSVNNSQGITKNIYMKGTKSQFLAMIKKGQGIMEKKEHKEEASKSTKRTTGTGGGKKC